MLQFASANTTTLAGMRVATGTSLFCPSSTYPLGVMLTYRCGVAGPRTENKRHELALGIPGDWDCRCGATSESSSSVVVWPCGD